MTTQLSLFGNADTNPAPFQHVLPNEPTIHVTLKFELPTRLLDDPHAALDWISDVASFEAQRFLHAILEKGIR